MRIVQTSHHYYPHTGGTERVVKILVEGLAELKNEVHIFSDSVDLKKLSDQDNVMHGMEMMILLLRQLENPREWASILWILRRDMEMVTVSRFSVLH